MIKILLLCSSRELPVIKRQLYNNPINNCYFVFSENEEHDAVVVMDNFSNPCKTVIPPYNRFYFLGEIPYIRRYNKNFLKQFGYVFGCNKPTLYEKGIHMVNLYPWFIGRSYNKVAGQWEPTLSFTQLEKYDNEKRTKNVCILSSNKKVTKGHKKRVDFINRILKDSSIGKIDVFGDGFVPFGDKFDILKDYKYSIVIENACYPDYFTEKVVDCLISGCYPIYYGCNEIFNYFPPRSMSIIDIDHYDEAKRIIKKTIDANYFTKYHNELRLAKKKALYDNNLFTIISDIVKEKYAESGKLLTPQILFPHKQNLLDKIKQKIARRYQIII